MAVSLVPVVLQFLVEQRNLKIKKWQKLEKLKIFKCEMKYNKLKWYIYAVLIIKKIV